MGCPTHGHGASNGNGYVCHMLATRGAIPFRDHSALLHMLIVSYYCVSGCASLQVLRCLAGRPLCLSSKMCLFSETRRTQTGLSLSA